MRLIDADKLLGIYKKWIPQLSSKEDEGDRCGVETCIAVLEDMPTIDAIPVVRCKNCKYQYEGLIGLICIKGPCVDCIVPEDFYCAYGEPKECDNND